jgi:tetratricopeptide (TPR) repeat protein
LLEQDGLLRRSWHLVIEEFLEHKKDHYLALITRRRPHAHETLSEQMLAMRVEELQPASSQRLLRQLLTKNRITFEPDEVAELSEYVAGYPPAAYAAVDLSCQYGFDSLLADKKDLIAFKHRSFQRFLNELKLSDQDWLILRYLAGEGQLTFDVLAIALQMDKRALAGALRSLMDLSLVQNRDRTLSIATPIRDSLFKLKGFLGTACYRDIASRLYNEFWVENSPPLTLPVVDATLHAAALAGRNVPTQLEPLMRGSTLERIATENYHRRDYQAALDFGLRGQLLKDGDSPGLRETRFKSYARLDRWDEANAELKGIEAAGDRHYFFLKGFGLRLRGDLKPAMSAFRSALDTLDRRAAVRRELAFCLYALQRYTDARKECESALERDPHNAFLLDLLVNICLGLKNFAAADQALHELERVDISQRFVHHRRAAYSAARGEYSSAIFEVELAIGTGSAAFEAHSLRVGIFIRFNEFDKASAALSDLIDHFPGQRHDVVVGLQCKSLVRQRRWREALQVWNQLRKQALPVHQGLLKLILLQKAEDFTIPLLERNGARMQAEAIAADLEALDLLDPAIDPEEVAR